MKLLIVLSILVVGLCGVTGWYITNRWFPAWGTTVVWVAAGINLFGCWTSFVPILVVQARKVEYLPQAAFGGMVFRLLFASFGLLGLMVLGPWDSVALSVWMFVFYLALLVVEVGVTIRALQPKTGMMEIEADS